MKIFPYLAFGVTFKNFFGLFQWHDKFEATFIPYGRQNQKK